jgi:hypothetical protein
MLDSLLTCAFTNAVSHRPNLPIHSADDQLHVQSYTNISQQPQKPAYHLLLQSKCTNTRDIDHRGVIRFHQHGRESGRHKVRASDVYRALDGDVLAASGGERQAR